MKDHVDQPKGHKMASMEHQSSNIPFGQITSGAPNEHHIEQGHKVHGSEHKNDGAGRHGHDESGHQSYSEHKSPTHGGGSHAPTHDGAGKMGYPGTVMGLDHDGGTLVGGDYSQSAHEPAVLRTPDGQGFTAGHAGIHAGMGSKPHGFGHQQSQKSGNLRNSGHPGAHRIGKR